MIFVYALAIALAPVGKAGQEPERHVAKSTPTTLGELVDGLERIAKNLESSEVILSEYHSFLREFQLVNSPELFRDYVRVRLVFEAARAGGFWQLGWKITNKEPNSDAIWRRLRGLPTAEVGMITAWAECDELSALFAFLVRKLGVRGVGLFWPQWNHVVAVWTIPAVPKSVRVVIPTSQIFLDNAQTLGTRAFDPWTQKTIYEYRRKDAADTMRLPGELVAFMLRQAERYGGKSQQELQQLRNLRAEEFGHP